MGMAPVAAVLPAAALASGGYAGSRSSYMVGEVVSESIIPIKSYIIGHVGPELILPDWMQTEEARYARGIRA